MTYHSNEVIIESVLNRIDIKDIEYFYPHRHIPVLPIGIHYRPDRHVYVVYDEKTTYYSGSGLNGALKALERLQGTIIYSKIIKQK